MTVWIVVFFSGYYIFDKFHGRIVFLAVFLLSRFYNNFIYAYSTRNQTYVQLLCLFRIDFYFLGIISQIGYFKCFLSNRGGKTEVSVFI